MRSKKLYLSLVLSLFLTGFFHSRLPEFNIYPPLLSKTYPLSTPAAFWSSSLGMRRLAGSILWIQAMQYYGTRPGDKKEISPELGREMYRMEPEGARQLYPELKDYWQQIIRIDPYMASAYLTGPATVGWNLRRYEEAMALLDEGIRAIESIIQRQQELDIVELAVPHPLLLGREPYLKELRDRLYILKTVIVFLEQEKFAEAVPHLEEIAAREDTPEEISIMLAQIYTQSHSYEKAFRLWNHLYETSPKESTRRIALDYLNRIEEEVLPSD